MSPRNGMQSAMGHGMTENQTTQLNRIESKLDAIADILADLFEYLNEQEPDLDHNNGERDQTKPL
jgi:hypothetical protein